MLLPACAIVTAVTLLLVVLHDETIEAWALRLADRIAGHRSIWNGARVTLWRKLSGFVATVPVWNAR